MRRRRLLVVAALCAVALLLPGWRGELREVPHTEVLAAARAVPPGTVFGVEVPDVDGAGTWHAQYLDSVIARLLRAAGMGASLTAVLPPSFAAHIPAGAERADGYFRLDARVHWPWWAPRGGVEWRDPRVPAEDS